MQLGVLVYHELRELVNFLRGVQQLPVPERSIICACTPLSTRRRVCRLLVTSAKEIMFYQRLSVRPSVCLSVCLSFYLSVTTSRGSY